MIETSCLREDAIHSASIVTNQSVGLEGGQNIMSLRSKLVKYSLLFNRQLAVFSLNAGSVLIVQYTEKKFIGKYACASWDFSCSERSVAC